MQELSRVKLLEVAMQHVRSIYLVEGPGGATRLGGAQAQEDIRILYCWLCEVVQNYPAPVLAQDLAHDLTRQVAQLQGEREAWRRSHTEVESSEQDSTWSQQGELMHLRGQVMQLREERDRLLAETSALHAEQAQSYGPQASRGEQVPRRRMQLPEGWRREMTDMSEEECEQIAAAIVARRDADTDRDAVPDTPTRTATVPPTTSEMRPV